MTKEQLKKGIDLQKQIDAMQLIKEKIEKYNFFVTYMKDNTSISSYEQSILQDILEKHDKMIREDMDKEIERLNKEIEAL